VKLRELHLSTVRRFSLNEEVDPRVHEKLGYLKMMVARQGKDPQKFIDRIKELVQPDFAKQAGAKMALSSWLKNAKRGNSKDGTSSGRKIRITVLESAIRELIIEGVFRNLGHTVLKKLRDTIGGRQEHKLLTAALDANPSFAAIIRYARKSDGYIYDDEGFWELVDHVTNGKAALIKRIVHNTFERFEESIERFDVLTECEINEARISSVMAELGLDQNTIKTLMRQFEIRDEDYDLSRLKNIPSKAKELGVGALGKAKELGVGALGKTKELGTGALGKAKELGVGALGKTKELGVGALGKAKELGTGAKDAATAYHIKHENEDFAEEVVKIAHALMKTLEKTESEETQFGLPGLS
jgi:hypothetical protein